MGEKMNSGSENNVSAEKIKESIENLTSKDGVRRQKARHELVAIGPATIEHLADLVGHPKDNIRWEVIKVLSQIKDPKAAPFLVGALEDESDGIRWLAAEGLVSLHRQGLVAVLHAMSESKISVFLRVGAHHVVKSIAEQYDFEGKDELLAILENNAAALEIPVISKKVLERLSQEIDSFRFIIR
jgi:HEAT repeat protein